MNGTVKWWNNEKGWGFAYGEDGHDYYMNWGALQDADPNCRPAVPFVELSKEVEELIK